MRGREGVESRGTTLGIDEVGFWSKRWHTASRQPGGLPSYEEVGLGSIGSHAAGLALLSLEHDHPKILQSSVEFDAWLHDHLGGSPRPDGLAKLVEMMTAALRMRVPVEQCCSGIHGDRIETRPLVAMPVASRWFTQLVLFYVGPLLTSHNVTETVYRSTCEGFLMLMPVRTTNGTIADFRVAAANPGAAALLGQSADNLVWGLCSTVFADKAPGLLAALTEVFEQKCTREFEVDVVSGVRDMHLRASASTLDSLVVLTLTDVTELRAREASFRLMFDANPVPMGLVDTTSMCFLDVNAAAVSHYGFPRAKLVGAPQTLLIHPDERGALMAVEADPAPSYEGARVWRHRCADGREIAVRPYARRLTIRKQPAALVAYFDVTESKLAEEELRATKLFVDTIIENIPSALLVEDADDGRLLLINRAGEEMLGVKRADVLGDTNRIPFPAVHADTRTAVEHAIARPDADPLLVSVTTVDVPGGRGAGRYKLTIADDITERRAIEDRIVHMAHHDALTDLPNRTLFTDLLKASLAQADHDSGIAVLGIDLDAFKAVNDTLGHAGGDAVLREVAARLSGAMQPGDRVARLGGDEFAVLITSTHSADIGAIAARIVTDLSRPVMVRGQEVAVGASVGIAVAPTDGSDCETLLHHADLALYRAKHEGKNTFRFFQAGMDVQAQAQRDLERDLRGALAQGEFELHYQPVVTMTEQRVSGCEALLRWRHPVRGLVPPSVFIPIAEETGLINAIGAWILRQACMDARLWPDDVTVAVNVSAVQFRDPQLIAAVISALAASGLDPKRLEIEITESVLLAHTKAHIATLHKLQKLGVGIAMDDFGTGYSSLSYLSTFAFDKIKIDQSFVRDMDTSRHCDAIVNAVIDLGRRLDIVTVAEGVETQEQARHLRDSGCLLAQGYFFSRPMPVSDLRNWLGSNGTRVLAAA